MTDINTYTTAEISALTPQSGDVVLDTDLNAVKLWNGSAWKVFDSDVSPFNNDYSVSLDGTNEQVVYNSTSGNQTALGSFTGDMSFCFWIKFLAHPLGYAALDILSTHSTYNSAGASGTFDGVRTGAGRVAFTCWNNGSQVYTYLESSRSVDGGDPSGRGANINEWTFVAVTVDTSAGNHTLYTATELLSPSLEATKPTTQSLDDFANGFKLGFANLLGYPNAYALFDEFAIFDGKALSASEVATIWNNGEAFDYGTDASLNPVGWYRMGDNVSGTGTLVTNAGSAGSGSAFDAELINGASFVSGTGNTPGN